MVVMMRTKLKAARVRKRRAEGRCEGRKPYGTRPGEAEVVAVIHKLRRKPRGGERLSFKTIADRLNAQGHPTRTGKPWARETVRQIANRRG
jgi:site-specific DNA recombinase